MVMVAMDGCEPPREGGAGDPLTALVFTEHMGIVHRQRQLLHRVFAKQHLHPAQAMCMRMLAMRGEVTQSELADAMILSRPSITRILQRMERAGLVTRRTAAADQRQTLVALTEEGRDLQHRLDTAMAEYVAVTLDRMPEHDRKELARILPIWRELADRALADPTLAGPAAAHTAAAQTAAVPTVAAGTSRPDSGTTNH
jgi:DNA-binding MarR family transcriptional regulator